MKRDMDLVRAILFEVEKHDDTGLEFEVFPEGNHSPQEIEYHVILCSEAGLIKAKLASLQEGWRPVRLTWRGHDFLEAARSDTTWAKANAVMGQAGGWVFSVGIQVLTEIIKDAALAYLKGSR